MKIVMVTPFGLRPKGTVRVRALPLAEGLVERGHKVTILIPPWDDPASAGTDFEQNGVVVRQLALPTRAYFALPYLTGQLLRGALAEQPDILHAFKPKAYSGFVATVWWWLQKLRLIGTPLVMDTDDWEGWGGWNDHAPYHRLQKWLFAWQEQWGLRHADGVTVASRTLESLVWSMGVAPERVIYLPNGSGARWATPDQPQVDALRARLGLHQAPVALLYTRFFEFDVTVLARRWAKIVALLPQARLLVVGKGFWGEEKRFHAAIAELGVSESVIDVGWQPFESLPAHFALATLMLYPMNDSLLNRTKCPVKLADMLQFGMPVVGEAVGQVKEYLGNHAGGVLVPPTDDDAFVAATLRLLRHPAQTRALAQSAQTHFATHFAWPIQAQRVERLYNKLAKR
ncbi:MAG: glycosyltransferase family 4 protein [Ardenticatenaceae bacterium]